MRKALTIVIAMCACSLANANDDDDDLHKIIDGISLYKSSVTVLKNPKRVNFTIRNFSPVDSRHYAKMNYTIYCHNQTIRLNRDDLYRVNTDEFVKSYPTNEERPVDIPRNSPPDLMYREFCK